VPDYYTGYYDESRLRGAQQGGAGYSDPGYVPDPSTPIQTSGFTYNNGGHFAGTNTPMSDQARNTLMQNVGQIPTDRDVLGGGKFGVRGWMNDHPLGVIAAFIAAAAGGGALAGGLGAGGAGAGAGAGGLSSAELSSVAGSMGGSLSGGLAGAGAGAGAAGAGSGGALGAGLGAAGAGAGVGFGGAGTGGIPADLVGDFAGTQAGAAGNGLVLSGGAGTGVPAWMSNYGKYASNLNGLLGGGGGGGGGSMPAMPSMGGMMGSQTQTPPMNASRQRAPLDQTITRYRGYQRTPLQFRGATVWL